MAIFCYSNSGKTKPLFQGGTTIQGQRQMKILGFDSTPLHFLLNYTTTRGLSDDFWAGPGGSVGGEKRAVPGGGDVRMWCSPLGVPDGVLKW